MHEEGVLRELEGYHEPTAGLYTGAENGICSVVKYPAVPGLLARGHILPKFRTFRYKCRTIIRYRTLVRERQYHGLSGSSCI